MRLAYLAGLALAAGTMTNAASAAIVTLTSVTPTAGNFTFNYQSTLGGDEGLQAGDHFVVFDFAGYVAGSVFSTATDFVASAQLVTPELIVPTQTDDPTLFNLIFTYTGPTIRAAGGPFASLDINGIGAVSTFSATKRDGFTTLTTKNNPAASAGTSVYELGTTAVPTGAVPEPAAWTLMIGGFGLVGAMTRRRRTAVAA